MFQISQYELEPLMNKLSKYAAKMVQYYGNILPSEIFKKHINKAYSSLYYLFENCHEISTITPAVELPVDIGFQHGSHTADPLLPSYHEFSNIGEIKTDMVANNSDTYSYRPPQNSMSLDDISHLWDFKQTVRYGLGAVMISNNYAKYMTSENLIRTIKAKIAFKCQMGILDDIIDRGNYNYSEAEDLYSLVVANMTSADYNEYSFKNDLWSILKNEQLKLVSEMVSNCSIFNGLFSMAKNRNRYMPYMEDLDRKVIPSQALTIYQKKDYFDLKKLKSVSDTFEGPDDDLLWQDKLSAYVSGGTRYNLIDLSFANDDFEINNMEDFMKGWYYFDIVIVYLNNIINVPGDHKDGIYNLSLIDMNGPVDKFGALSDIKLTEKCYLGHLERNAVFMGRGLEYILKSVDDPDRYYSFITFMIPIVMMAEWIGENDKMIAYVISEMAKHYPT